MEFLNKAGNQCPAASILKDLALNGCLVIPAEFLGSREECDYHKLLPT